MMDVDARTASTLTVRAALARYLREISAFKAPGSTRRDWTSARALADRLGDYSLAEVTSNVAATYRSERSRDRSQRTGRTISPTSVRLELLLLSHLFTVAINEWGLDLNGHPVKAIKKPRVPRGRTRRLDPSSHEAARLLGDCGQRKNPMFRWIVQLALETAMRRSEISHLRLRQVDLTRRFVTLPKTKNSWPRTVPLTKTAASVLEAAVAHPRPRDTDLLFWGPRLDSNGARHPYNFTRAWNTTLAKGNFPDLRFHDLRHEAISRFYEMGLSDQEVSDICGIRSMQVLKRYTHLRSERLVQRLDALSEQRQRSHI
jgi:integrase